MRSVSAPPSPARQLLLGSRPSATPMVRLALEDVPAHQRPARLRDFFERLGVRYDIATVGDHPIEIGVTLQGLPGIQVLSARMQGVNVRRTRQNSDPTEDVGLAVNPQGLLQVSQRGRELVLGPGDATLVSLTEPLGSIHRAPSDFLVLRVPLPLIAPYLATGQDAVLNRIPGAAPPLRLLTNYLNIAWQEQTLASHDLQGAVVSHIYDLMALAIGSTRDAEQMARGRGLRAAQMHAIKQDIVRHLHRPDLSVSAIADRHGLTARFVQRLFEADDATFTQYVLSQRLLRARRMLIDPRYAGEKISSIAYDCGFGDISYFNRIFRRHYGATPSDVRTQTPLEAADGLE
jgi:AraC-like DNA-binding protein